jgi:transcriptional regulator with XRE-family HTH domain
MQIYSILKIEDNQMNFIRFTRFQKRLTLDQLSCLTGIDQSALSRFERGLKRPSLEQKRLIAEALNYEVDELFPEEKKNG